MSGDAQPRILYTREEAAFQLSISVATLDRLVGSKQLTARRVGRRVLIAHVELMKLSRRDVPHVDEHWRAADAVERLAV